jgi:hypothetical protein
LGWKSEGKSQGKSVRARLKARVRDRVEAKIAGTKGIAPAPTILDKLISLKSGIQDDLLTGRVRVPETIMERTVG